LPSLFSVKAGANNGVAESKKSASKRLCVHIFYKFSGLKY
jgi:hypothetical protein